ncbi:unnamed protein product [Closterium sp. Yama58-4]|nr:unnamed protein product [Closterium sp. Yama58-4]
MEESPVADDNGGYSGGYNGGMFAQQTSPAPPLWTSLDAMHGLDHEASGFLPLDASDGDESQQQQQQSDYTHHHSHQPSDHLNVRRDLLEDDNFGSSEFDPSSAASGAGECVMLYQDAQRGEEEDMVGSLNLRISPQPDASDLTSALFSEGQASNNGGGATLGGSSWQLCDNLFAEPIVDCGELLSGDGDGDDLLAASAGHDEAEQADGGSGGEEMEMKDPAVAYLTPEKAPPVPASSDPVEVTTPGCDNSEGNFSTPQVPSAGFSRPRSRCPTERGLAQKGALMTPSGGATARATRENLMRRLAQAGGAAEPWTPVTPAKDEAGKRSPDQLARVAVSLDAELGLFVDSPPLLWNGVAEQQQQQPQAQAQAQGQGQCFQMPQYPQQQQQQQQVAFSNARMLEASSSRTMPAGTVQSMLGAQQQQPQQQYGMAGQQQQQGLAGQHGFCATPGEGAHMRADPAEARLSGQMMLPKDLASLMNDADVDASAATWSQPSNNTAMSPPLSNGYNTSAGTLSMDTAAAPTATATIAKAEVQVKEEPGKAGSRAGGLTGSSSLKESGNQAFQDDLGEDGAVEDGEDDEGGVIVGRKRSFVQNPAASAARKRRHDMNQRLKVLVDLVPNSSKGDTASMLLEVIDYVKALMSRISEAVGENTTQQLGLTRSSSTQSQASPQVESESNANGSQQWTLQQSAPQQSMPCNGTSMLPPAPCNDPTAGMLPAIPTNGMSARALQAAKFRMRRKLMAAKLEAERKNGAAPSVTKDSENGEVVSSDGDKSTGDAKGPQRNLTSRQCALVKVALARKVYALQQKNHNTM